MSTPFRNLSLLLFISLLLACGDSSAPASAPPVDDASAATAESGQAPPPAGEPTYPSIPLDTLEMLWNEGTYMDATFYNLPVSLNQSTPNQIRSSITYIAEQAPVINPDCKPVGHLWFQVNGVNRAEADIYFQPGCTYYVWFENKQPVYANLLTPEGISFYNNIFRSVSERNQ